MTLPTERDAFVTGVARFCKESGLDVDDNEALVDALLMPEREGLALVMTVEASRRAALVKSAGEGLCKLAAGLNVPGAHIPQAAQAPDAVQPPPPPPPEDELDGRTDMGNLFGEKVIEMSPQLGQQGWKGNELGDLDKFLKGRQMATLAYKTGLRRAGMSFRPGPGSSVDWSKVNPAAASSPKMRQLLERAQQHAGNIRQDYEAMYGPRKGYATRGSDFGTGPYKPTAMRGGTGAGTAPPTGRAAPVPAAQSMRRAAPPAGTKSYMSGSYDGGMPMLGASGTWNSETPGAPATWSRGGVTLPASELPKIPDAMDTANMARLDAFGAKQTAQYKADPSAFISSMGHPQAQAKVQARQAESAQSDFGRMLDHSRAGQTAPAPVAAPAPAPAPAPTPAPTMAGPAAVPGAVGKKRKTPVAG
jgi:hypothetical protein